ncbi:hypothetical protein GUJ93_ZPchr0002g24443 [Zizania palustris]|uniref:Uncharacterized protein n=1 Tax=Zizania palustris TaxID=103762 RepID=A0A8J5SC33_ZIZPA|nr:hypothetical protein GUJ93_ZPchr0002g24443 [Zizania palustris]
MQRRFIVVRGVLRGFGIVKIVVFVHFGDSWGGLRAKPVRSLLSPPRYLGLKIGHLSGHISKAIFISSGRTFRVLRTDDSDNLRTGWLSSCCFGNNPEDEIFSPNSVQLRSGLQKQANQQPAEDFPCGNSGSWLEATAQFFLAHGIYSGGL